MKIDIRLIITLFWISVIETGSVSAQTVTVDFSTEYQIIRGFGGMNHTTWIKDLNEDNREKAFGNDPGEIGLSILRMHVDPNPARFYLEVPTASFAAQKGATLFATPWNAPDALLDPNSTQSRVLPSKYGDYAAHLNSFDSYMDKNGAPLYCVSVQNEPDWGEWTRWSASEMLDFMANYAQNINNKVMAPESFQFRRSFTDPILNNEKAAANLEIVGGHIYGGGLFDYPLARLKGKEVWMTEHLLGSGDGYVNNWDLALTVGKEINDCMQANFNAYVWWYIRRSYGLITDDGNITDKGYVISQFSKFVRPGAVRINADVTSGSLVDVTAYKTDTSLVMVVVNRNSTDKKLNFDIKNGSVDKLSQFTTSSKKKALNDGDLSVSGGFFTATVDAISVTTFTSYSGNGGKAGNVKPTAFAGDDLVIDDVDGVGSKVITLDGSQSKDSDGEIVNYSWSVNDEQIAWSPKAELTISSGDYNYILTVTDNDGATAVDTFHVSLISSNKAEVWLEAECASPGANWNIVADSDASNGFYVTSKPGIQSLIAAAGSVGTLVFPFTVETAGTINLYARLNCPTADDDSFWVKLDNGSFLALNGLVTSGWEWMKLTNFFLNTGQHKITITYREDGAKLDKISLINGTNPPSGKGGSEQNACVPIPTSINSVQIHDGFSLEQNYPNPFNERTIITFEIPKDNFVSLKIYNMPGIEIGELAGRNFPQGKHTVEFNSGKLSKGIYFYTIRAGDFSASQKMIIQKE
ncbi:MAG: T9SS type A sorting domain-containing protein [Prolixibacteraceae bacterium]